MILVWARATTPMLVSHWSLALLLFCRLLFSSTSSCYQFPYYSSFWPPVSPLSDCGPPLCVMPPTQSCHHHTSFINSHSTLFTMYTHHVFLPFDWLTHNNRATSWMSHSASHWHRPCFIQFSLAQKIQLQRLSNSLFTFVSAPNTLR